MTKKTGRSADNDPSLAALINANTPAVCGWKILGLSCENSPWY